MSDTLVEEAFSALKTSQQARGMKAWRRLEDHEELLPVLQSMDYDTLNAWIDLDTRRYFHRKGMALGSQDLDREWSGGSILGTEKDPERIQPSTWEPILGNEAYWIRSEGNHGFRMHKSLSVEEALDRIPKTDRIRFDIGKDELVLQPGNTYLVNLSDYLMLGESSRARASPKSSIGRVFLQTRLVADYQDTYDYVTHIPGDDRPTKLWLLLEPKKFGLIIKKGIPLTQIMHLEGYDPRLSEVEIKHLLEGGVPLLTIDGEPAHGYLGKTTLTLDLEGRMSNGIAGLKAISNPNPIDLSKRNEYELTDYFEPVRAREGTVRLRRGEYWLFNSRETLNTPPYLCMKMQTHSALSFIGRNDFAGFIDQGFNRPLVFEIESYENTPQLLLHGSKIDDLTVYYSGLTTLQYGMGELKSNYAEQSGPQPSKHFKTVDWSAL